MKDPTSADLMVTCRAYGIQGITCLVEAEDWMEAIAACGLCTELRGSGFVMVRTMSGGGARLRDDGAMYTA